MSYSGNASLAADVQARILEAYRHSLESAAAGNRQEALLGCDFILRLDPLFEPANELQQMLDQDRPADAFADLLAAAGAAAPASRGFTAASPGLVSTFSRLLEARRFEELLTAAQAQSAAVAGDPKLREVVAQAQARFEAEPLVRQFLDKARAAVGSGRLEEVDSLLDKVRDLDATHPGLAEIERLRSSAASLQTSLKIDWDDDEEAASAVPPPAAEFDESPFSAPDLPDLSIEPPTPSPFAVGAGDMAPSTEPPAAPAPQPSGTPSAPDLGDLPSSLELPEIDFSIAPSDEGGGFELDAGSLEPEVEERPGAFDGTAEDEADSAARVAALLAEGDGAFDRGEYQAAIDSWSRIFLIDIDNSEAAQRIERARQLKAEREREVEEIFHGGVARFDAGDWDDAREAFLKVIEIQPSYVLAREYLEKIDEREGAGDDGEPRLPEIAPATFGTGGAPSEAPRPGHGRGEEILVPPEPGSEHEVRRPAVDGFAVRARRGVRPSPLFIGIGGAVLALLLVGGWLLADNWGRLFPNAAPTAPAVAAPNPVAQAKKLQNEGKTAAAIAQLRRVPPQDARYAEAQSLVSQWEKLRQEAAGPALSEPRSAERAALLERAAASMSGGENLLARRLYTQAAEIAPLDGFAATRAAEAEAKLVEYRQEMQLMRDGEYEMALNRLWRRHEADPADRDTRRLMVDSYYNLSVSDLQRGAPKDARQKLKEARALDRDDPMLARLERFSATYERRDVDLLYRIFVKYLPMR